MGESWVLPKLTGREQTHRHRPIPPHLLPGDALCPSWSCPPGAHPQNWATTTLWLGMDCYSHFTDEARWWEVVLHCERSFHIYWALINQNLLASNCLFLFCLNYSALFPPLCLPFGLICWFLFLYPTLKHIETRWWCNNTDFISPAAECIVTNGHNWRFRVK